MLFVAVPLLLGIMGYLLAVITPMLTFITLLCLISSIAGILIIAIVLIVGYMLYKLVVWAKKFYEESIKPWVDMVVDWFKKIWEWAENLYKGYIEPVINKIIDLWNKYLQPVIDWITNTLMSVVGWIWDSFKAGWDVVSGVINSIWEFLSNPAKMVSGVASKVGSAVSEKFAVVTDKLSSWGKSVVNTINPKNWFAEGKIALEPMRAVFAEAGPEAAIPLNDQGLAFLKKTFNLDDKSFNIALNNSSLYKAILEIKDQNIEIKEIVDGIDYKMSNMERPSFFESITTSYANMYSVSPTTSDNKVKKETPGDTILKKLDTIEKLIKDIPASESSSNVVEDTEMSIAKMISTGILNRR
jgi:hypothetical protein